jgi:translocation and assembly module TamB
MWRKSAPWLALAVGGTAALAGIGWFSADLVAERLYVHWRPQLERQLTAAFGHPLEIGAFGGIGWSGLQVGPTRVLPHAGDPSSLRIRRMGISLDLISSLRRRLPVLQLNLNGLDLDLRRNAAGGYWRFGRVPADQVPPKLDLRLRLGTPGRVRLSEAGLDLAIRGGATIHPHQSALSGRISLGATGQAEAPLQLAGGGQWNEQRWRGTLVSRRLDLAQLHRTLGLPGQLTGKADGRLQLAWDGGRPECQGELRLRGLRWRGDGQQSALELQDPRLLCQGTALRLPASRWTWRNLGGVIALRSGWGDSQVRVETLELRHGDSWFRGTGWIGKRLNLAGSWQLLPSDLPLPNGTPLPLLGGVVRGSLQVAGDWQRPSLSSTLGQQANPLLDDWRATVAWQDQVLVLTTFNSTHLRGEGSIPLALARGNTVTFGPLDLRTTLRQYPLERLSPIFGTRLGGTLTAQGRVQGELSGLTPTFDLKLESPEVGPLRLAELWRGDWLGDPAGGGRLSMRPSGDDGALEARLDRRWVPVAIALERQGGRLQLDGSPRAYRWQAQGFPLGGLALALGPTGRFQPVQGSLSGSGLLELQPLAFRGRVDLDRPTVLGVTAGRVRLDGSYAQRQYRARADVAFLDGGNLDVDWSGRWKGAFRARLQGEGLGDALVRQLLEAWPRWNGRQAADPGSASDLGSLLIDTLGGSIDHQLDALNRAHADVVRGRQAQRDQLTTAERLERVAARFDLKADLSGPRLVDTRVDLNLRGHLWLPGQDRDQALTSDPLLVSLQGPLRLGGGQLSLSGVPLALLALLTPIPAELRGTLAARVRYSLATAPELAVDLALQDAGLGDTSLSLQRGSIILDGDGLQLDLSARAAEASAGIDLVGRVPLDPSQDGVELRLSSRDDGLIFLSGLAAPAFIWKEGRADLQLLVRGSLLKPIANGFLRVQNGRLEVVGQPVQDLQATVLFDFEQLFLQDFSAQVASSGRLTGTGSLGLLTPQRTTTGDPALVRFKMADVPIRFPRIAATAAGELEAGGSLAALVISGDLAFSKGSINVQPSRLEAESSPGPGTASVAELAEQRWSFQQPLVLFGPDVESEASEQLRALIPNLGMVRFDDLTLSLGPDLGVGVPGLASFQTEGSLRINGPFNPSIQARGVVRLRQGRLGLFTTTFTLDPGAPNVAVFTPSLGLVPYLDITLRTRVSDSLTVGGVYSEASGGTSQFSPSLAQVEPQAGFNSLNQLNLVQVFLSVSGPADRLADNLSLRSSPPLPQQRLLALIGGNSLAGVVGGRAGAALATVIGQSLLSPILGTLGDAFGQRLSLAIYPAYVNQALNRSSEQRSERVPPQLVVATELGVDISERLSASVLAAPNVDNVPPQLNLTLKASELLNLQGSIDTEGAWQTQLQVFFRF